MPKVILGLIPPRGHHYYEGDAKITGSTFADLVRNIESYRAENHYPIGDPETDATNYICGNWPNFCHGVDMVVVESINPPNPTAELLNDITTWAKNVLHSNHAVNLVSDELAEARAQTCAHCPHNRKWRSGCGSCIVAADRLSASIRHGRDTKTSKKLGGCGLMRHDNRSAVFMDKEQINKTNNIPDNCWLK